MKPIIWIGIVFIILGGLALAYQRFPYTYRERVFDLGPIRATAEKYRQVSIPPVFGGLAVVGGVVLLGIGTRKSF
jgi:hypothetical protein